jgi:hypothetical protein
MVPGLLRKLADSVFCDSIYTKFFLNHGVQYQELAWRPIPINTEGGGSEPEKSLSQLVNSRLFYITL